MRVTSPPKWEVVVNGHTYTVEAWTAHDAQQKATSTYRGRFDAPILSVSCRPDPAVGA